MAASDRDVRIARGQSFDSVAALYDSARPSYPEAVFDLVSDLGGFASGASLIEVGCGTGQATAVLARRGYRVTCVELGRELAHLAERNLAGWPDVEVVNANFEEWDAPRHDFDGVVMFSVFHWLDPDVALSRSAAVLRPGGALAVVRNRPVRLDGHDTFVVDVLADYRAMGAPGDATAAPPPEELPDDADALGRCGHFASVEVGHHLSSLVFDADAYVALLSTYSAHRAMPTNQRNDLFGRIRRRIDDRPGGQVEVWYQATVTVGCTPRRGASR